MAIFISIPTYHTINIFNRNYMGGCQSGSKGGTNGPRNGGEYIHSDSTTNGA